MKEFKTILESLQLNNFFSMCKTITPQDSSIVFYPPFTATPEVFVVTNKFTIEYGAQGSLTKDNAEYEVSAKEITFNTKNAVQNISIPVCVLAIEKNK